METFPVAVLNLANEWLRLDRDPATRSEIAELLKCGAIQELTARMKPRITFGTAGLRARMEAGFSRMNELTVTQTSQGLASYLLQNVNGAAEKGVVIGYDARHNSKRFALKAAEAFHTKGIQIWWHDSIVHTPMIPYSVNRLGAAAGIMITASHNPAADNGYKVYGSNSCQINSPADKMIAATILENLEPISYRPDQDGEALLKIGQDGHLRFRNVSHQLIPDYHTQIQGLLFSPLNPKITPRFVYTPLHGVGLSFLTEGLRRAFEPGISGSEKSSEDVHSIMKVVRSQARPDPDFPTVKYPNPEESGALDLAEALADEEEISLVFANDPDADRFSIAEKVDGVWHQLTGDQVGVFLGYYMYQLESHTKSMTMLTSAVSSQMLASMGEHEGFTVEETLTGFKWLGNRALTLGSNVVFGYEEALGYMFPQFVRDKDGIAAALVFLKACSEWNSPWAKLQELYQKYGYFENLNTYWRCAEPHLVAAAFAKIRQSTKELPFSRKLDRYRDLTLGIDTGTADQKPVLPTDNNTQMITFWLSGSDFDDGIRFTIRASGTEPKVKIYLECRSDQQGQARKGAMDILSTINLIWFSDERLVLEDRYQLC
ncbi:Phosphoglucomutase-3 [Ptychographa xylographoides]|nr:Phosphoglucomutase-3 [Ptychographa xylographoides]